jgi:3-oxoacyl-[acyl-carrier-protein] synthase II
MDGRRVVVTGMGAISCVGNSVKETWDALVEGRCGIDRISRFDLSAYRTQIGGESKASRSPTTCPRREAGT